MVPLYGYAVSPACKYYYSLKKLSGTNTLAYLGDNLFNIATPNSGEWKRLTTTG
jgi:hypothetical protein